MANLIDLLYKVQRVLENIDQEDLDTGKFDVPGDCTGNPATDTPCVEADELLKEIRRAVIEGKPATKSSYTTVTISINVENEVVDLYRTVIRDINKGQLEFNREQIAEALVQVAVSMLESGDINIDPRTVAEDLPSVQ